MIKRNGKAIVFALIMSVLLAESTAAEAIQPLVLEGGGPYAATQAARSVMAEDELQQTVEDTIQEQTAEDGQFQYVHDPRLNPSAMKDIVENPEAVYGFSPDPESTRLGVFASYDWTDPEVVEKARQERIAYHEQNEGLYTMMEQLQAEGKSIEEVARAVSEERNRLRLAAYEGDPEGLAAVKQSNLETYGNENGPTADYLYEKYGSWETVLEKAFSVNSGMDACLGLYDDYYDLYVATGQITLSSPTPTLTLTPTASPSTAPTLTPTPTALPSLTPTLTPEVTKPTTVTGITAAPAKARTSVKISWTQVPSADGYIIRYAYKKTMANSQKVQAVGNSVFTKTIKDLTPDKTIYIQLRAYINSGTKIIYGDWSDVTSYIPKPTQATEVKAVPSAKTKKALKVSWAKVPSCNGYEIRYSYKTKISQGKKVTIPKGTTLNKTIKKLTSGKYVYVQVRAYKNTSNGKLYGDWSKKVRSKGKIR